MQQLKDKWLRLLGMPLVAVIGNFVFCQPDNDYYEIDLLKALLISLLELSCYGKSATWVFCKPEKSAPGSTRLTLESV